MVLSAAAIAVFSSLIGVARAQEVAAVEPEGSDVGPQGGSTSPRAAERPVEPELWAGHIVVRGERNLPILGKLEPRTDTWVIARVTEQDGSYYLDQHPCRVGFAPMLGTRISMLPDSGPLLPGVAFRFEPEGDGGLRAELWESGWGEEDIDQDGNPGATVQVRAALCGGDLQMATVSRNRATAEPFGDALRGEIEVEVTQRILGADGACLRVVAKDSVDEMVGVFAYAPVPTGSTCETLGVGEWPVSAE